MSENTPRKCKDTDKNICTSKKLMLDELNGVLKKVKELELKVIGESQSPELLIVLRGTAALAEDLIRILPREKHVTTLEAISYQLFMMHTDSLFTQIIDIEIIKEISKTFQPSHQTQTQKLNKDMKDKIMEGRLHQKRRSID